MPREGSELLRLEMNAADQAIDIKQGAIFTITCYWHQASMLVSRAFIGHAGLHLLCSSWEPLLHRAPSRSSSSAGVSTFSTRSPGAAGGRLADREGCEWAVAADTAVHRCWRQRSSVRSVWGLRLIMAFLAAVSQLVPRFGTGCVHTSNSKCSNCVAILKNERQSTRTRSTHSTTEPAIALP